MDFKINVNLLLIIVLLFITFCSTNPVNNDNTEIKDDYLPLNIGNTWYYNYSGNSRDDIDQNSSRSNGSALIKLISIEKEKNNYKYYLTLNKEGMSIYRNLNISTGVITIDTTYISVADTIIFIEDSSNVVRNYSPGFFGFKLPRYVSNESDTLIYHSAYTSYTMIKNVGIVSYGYDSYHNFSGSWGTWTLKSYELID